MTAMVWLRVLGVLGCFWLAIHGPRLPASTDERTLTLEQTLAGVGLGSSLLLLMTFVGCALTPNVAGRLRIRGASAGAYLFTLAAVLGTSFSLEGLATWLGLHESGELANLKRLFASLEPPQLWWAAAFLGVGPGFAEELCFRGWVLGRIAAVSGVYAGMAVSALAFGLFHYDLMYVVVTSVLGGVLGLSVIRSGALGPVMVAHAVNNSASVLGAGFGAQDTLGAKGLFLAGSLAAAGWGCFRLWRLESPR